MDSNCVILTVGQFDTTNGRQRKIELARDEVSGGSFEKEQGIRFKLTAIVIQVVLLARLFEHAVASALALP